MLKLPLRNRGIGARIRNSGNFSCPNNALTAVTFDVIDSDTLGTVDLINRNTKIVMPKEGWYCVIGGMSGWVSNSTNERAHYLTLNGTSNFARQVKGGADDAPNAYMQLMGLIYCVAGDYVQHFAYQNISGGGSLNLVGATFAVIQMG